MAHLNLIDKEDIEYLISVQHPWILSLDILVSRVGQLTMRLPNYKGYNSISQ